MRSFNLKTIAVTVWFVLGEFIICMAFVADAFTTQKLSANSDLSFWMSTTTVSCGAAVLAGALVDAVRYVASAIWNEDLTHRLSLTRVLQQNLT